MNSGKRYESVQSMGYILCNKDNDIILKNTTIKDLGDCINLLTESTTFNNQHLSPSNINVPGYLASMMSDVGQFTKKS